MRSGGARASARGRFVRELRRLLSGRSSPSSNRCGAASLSPRGCCRSARSTSLTRRLSHQSPAVWVSIQGCFAAAHRDLKRAADHSRGIRPEACEPPTLTGRSDRTLECFDVSHKPLDTGRLQYTSQNSKPPMDRSLEGRNGANPAAPGSVCLCGLTNVARPGSCPLHS